MTGPDVGPEQRLYGMMQHLLARFAGKADPGSANDRGVVTQQDALDAIVLLAAAIDEPAQAGLIDRNKAFHMGALLMVVRECVQSLPEGLGDPGGSDLVAPDLQAMVGAIRQGIAQHRG